MATGSFFHPPNRHRIDSLKTAEAKSRGRMGWESVPPTPEEMAGNLAYHFTSSPAAKAVHAHITKNIQDFGPQRHYLRGQSALRPHEQLVMARLERRPQHWGVFQWDDSRGGLGTRGHVVRECDEGGCGVAHPYRMQTAKKPYKNRKAAEKAADRMNEVI